MYYRKVISLMLFILLFLGTIVNYDTNAAIIVQIHTAEQIILAYNAPKVLVEVYHFSLESGEELIERELVEEKVGMSINSRNYIKKISSYEFSKIEPEILMVDENNRTINIFYKYIGEEDQEPDEDLEQDKDDDINQEQDKEDGLDQDTDKDDELEEIPDKDEDLGQSPDDNLQNESEESLDEGNDNADADSSGDKEGENNMGSNGEETTNKQEQSTTKIPQTGLPVNLVQLGYIVLLAGIIFLKE